jgi:hypothetical protein
MHTPSFEHSAHPDHNPFWQRRVFLPHMPHARAPAPVQESSATISPSLVLADAPPNEPETFVARPVSVHSGVTGSLATQRYDAATRKVAPASICCSQIARGNMTLPSITRKPSRPKFNTTQQALLSHNPASPRSRRSATLIMSSNCIVGVNEQSMMSGVTSVASPKQYGMLKQLLTPASAPSGIGNGCGSRA